MAVAEVSSGLSLLTPLMLCIRCQICTARQLPSPVGNKHGAGSRALCTTLPSLLSRLRSLHLAVSKEAGCLLAFSHSSDIFGHGTGSQWSGRRVPHTEVGPGLGRIPEDPQLPSRPPQP